MSGSIHDLHCHLSLYSNYSLPLHSYPQEKEIGSNLEGNAYNQLQHE